MRVGVSPVCRQVWRCIPVLFLFSCGAKNEAVPVVPPETPPLSRAVIGYGVINVSYTHAADIPDAAGLSLGYLRRGSVVKILERRLVKNAGNTESWVLAEEGSAKKVQGWLPALVVDIYDSEGRAKTASESMAR
jgi:hypothetical protein